MTALADAGATATEFQISGLLDYDCKDGEVVCEGPWVTVQKGNKTCVRARLLMAVRFCMRA